jgi:plastocyanin
MKRRTAARRVVVVVVVGAVGLILAVPRADAADHRVGQKDKRFTPAEVQIKTGDTITFVNDDLTIHNIYSETPNHEFEIKRQSPKQENTVAFAKPGRFTVECKYHGQMKLVVHVTP